MHRGIPFAATGLAPLKPSSHVLSVGQTEPDVSTCARQLPIRPSEHISVLAPLLPDRYAPLRYNGAGLQSVYLIKLSERIAGPRVGGSIPPLPPLGTFQGFPVRS